MTTETEIPQELVEPFVIAAHWNMATVREMLEQEPRLLNVPWAKFDETAIQAASHVGQREIAEYLLERGAPMNICTAAMLGRVETVEEYLRDDPTLANAKGAHDIPVMFHAALSGEPQVGELLLAHGGGEGMSGALHAAISYGHTEMVRWLIEHGADDLNVTNYEGKSALFAAEERGHEEIAAMLRERGAIAAGPTEQATA